MTELLVCFVAMTGVALTAIYRWYRLMKLVESDAYRRGVCNEVLREQVGGGQSDVDKSEGWMPCN